MKGIYGQKHWHLRYAGLHGALKRKKRSYQHGFWGKSRKKKTVAGGLSRQKMEHST